MTAHCSSASSCALRPPSGALAPSSPAARGGGLRAGARNAASRPWSSSAPVRGPSRRDPAPAGRAWPPSGRGGQPVDGGAAGRALPQGGRRARRRDRLRRLLSERGLRQADVVVSGLPWAAFPGELQRGLLERGDLGDEPGRAPSPRSPTSTPSRWRGPAASARCWPSGSRRSWRAYGVAQRASGVRLPRAPPSALDENYSYHGVMDFSLPESALAVQRGIGDICSRYDLDYWQRCESGQALAGGGLGGARQGRLAGPGRPGGVRRRRAGAAGARGGHGDDRRPRARRAVSAFTYVLTPGFGALTLARHGTTEQRAELLPRLATGEVETCFALTEPDAGLQLAGDHDVGPAATAATT